MDPLEHTPLEENDSDDDINGNCYTHIEKSNA